MITFDDIENVVSSISRAATEREAARRLENGPFWRITLCLRRTKYQCGSAMKRETKNGFFTTEAWRTQPTVGALGENATKENIGNSLNSSEIGFYILAENRCNV
jgi:hypothetical protein